MVVRNLGPAFIRCKMSEDGSAVEKRDAVNLVDVHLGNDYDSAFEYDSEAERQRRGDTAAATTSEEKAARDVVSREYDKEEKRRERNCFFALDAYTRHKKLVNDYILCYPGTTSKLKRDTSRDRTDFDVIRENHKFLWDETSDSVDTWEKQLAKRYYDKLFKEYCICDLTYYKANKIAMRWRTQQEVVDGRGQFTCGEKKCNSSSGMRTWEVNFAYLEKEERKNALVKLRLCRECSFKLNYRFQRKEVTKKPEKRKVLEVGEPSEVKKKKSDELVVEEKAEGVTGEESVWAKPCAVDEEKSKEEEFDMYLADMFL